MRARTPLAILGIALGVFACLPKPDQDFDDYVKRAEALPAPAPVEGGTFEASAPPVEAVSGIYYGVCLSQLAFGQLNDVLGFYTESSFAPDPAGGGKLSLKLQPLKLGDDKNPPTTISKAGVVGDLINVTPAAPNVAAADGKYTVDLGTVTVPGEANPITGRNIVIDKAKLQGFFGKERFCAKLSGDLAQPVQQPLEADRNICQFFPIKDGDPAPTLKREDFEASACPF